MVNSKVLFLSDNQAVVDVLNKQSCRDKILMRLVLCTLSYNIVFRAKHIAGKSNIVADKLSRFHFQKARQVAPWLNLTPAEIPEHLLTI